MLKRKVGSERIIILGQEGAYSFSACVGIKRYEFSEC
jgi:hypothetical protein